MPTKNRVKSRTLKTVHLTSEEDAPHCVLKEEVEPSAESELAADERVFKVETEAPVADDKEISQTVMSADGKGQNQILISASGHSKSTQPSPRALQRFGAYDLLWEICRDALSTTWAAQREGIERPLALRIFNSRVTDSAQVRSIQKAARKAAGLTHSNHVTVYESGVGENGAPYVVTDWIEGDTLADTFLVNKRLDIAGFLNIFNQVGEALIEAHSFQLVHGNLSPSKIILMHQDDVDSEMVKLIDFGMPADPVQNAFYMSPEQCLDRNKVDERSDIYSLGCLMYESLVGSPPFVGDKISQASTNYLHQLANQYGKDTPEHNALKLLDCIIIKCLQKKPSKRFRNVREVMDALRLVADCVCNGSRKRLPPKAEKLLLFRFLDFFDKKIVACACAYLILGMVSLKYIGELQLQNYIDDAQLFSSIDLPQATANWRAALKQAQLSQKPPSLQAELEWGLADSLVSQYHAAKTAVSCNAFADEARQHYEEAYKYFSRGQHYRCNSLALLNAMSSMWLSRENPEDTSEHRDATRQKVKKLCEQKKFAECIKLAADFLKKFSDDEISYYAGCANNEIGTKLPAKEALRYFERAEFLFSQSGSFNPHSDEDIRSSNVHKCLENQGYDANSQDTRLALGLEAFADGDLDAAQYELTHVCEPVANEFFVAMFQYRNCRQVAYLNEVGDSKNAIAPLERALELQQKAYGIHESALAPTLSRLASCYREQKAYQKAIDTYKRLFTIIPDDAATDDVLAYVDLLAENGHRQEARKELERKVIDGNGKVRPDNELVPRLMQAYASDKMTAQAMHLIKAVVKVPKMVKLWTYYPGSYRRHPVPFPTSSVPLSTKDDPFANGQ